MQDEQQVPGESLGCGLAGFRAGTQRHLKLTETSLEDFPKQTKSVWSQAYTHTQFSPVCCTNAMCVASGDASGKTSPGGYDPTSDYQQPRKFQHCSVNPAFTGNPSHKFHAPEVCT